LKALERGPSRHRGIAGCRLTGMKARKDDPVVCECGEPGGKFLQDVQNGAPIKSEDLALNALPGDATVYACKNCRKTFATLVSGWGWRVRTMTGWID
jgi:hypothetical protein